MELVEALLGAGLAARGPPLSAGASEIGGGIFCNSNSVFSMPGKWARDKWWRGKGCNSLQPRNSCTNYCPNYCTIVALRATIVK